jgi:hypothetical protein
LEVRLNLKEAIMSATRETLRNRFVESLLASARSLQAGPDPETQLEALIEAAGIVQEKLRQELAELRVEQAD